MKGEGRRYRVSAAWFLIPAATALFATGSAPAQPYPARAIRMIVPFSPGGASDVSARIVGQKLAERWGQQVVVENRSGAGGTIGADLAAKAAPDGYTLLMGSSTEIAINPHLYTRLAYNTVRDFAPVTRVASIPLILVTHSSLPVKSVKELVALAKARPGELNYASSGNGSTLHLAGEMFKKTAGVEMLHVPHTGSAPAVVSLMSGETQVMLAAMPAALPQARAGRLRVLAVTSAKRVAAASEVPTMIEAGVPGYEILIWTGLLAPAGTPADILNRLNAEVIKILALSDVRQGFANQGAEIQTSSREEFAGYIKSELAKFARVVKEAGVKID